MGVKKGKFLNYIVVDLGGTKARVGLAIDGTVDPATVKNIASDDVSCLEDAVSRYLKLVDVSNTKSLCGIAVGVAGPVDKDFAEVTNLGWIIQSNKLIEAFKDHGINAIGILNDLEAFAWGVLSLSDRQITVINPGSQKKGNKAVVAAGTGLGMAGISLLKNNTYFPFATEGGHSSFSPSRGDESMLVDLRKIYGDHVSFERVVSGKFGFSSLLHCFRGGFREELSSELNNVPSHKLGPVVVKQALAGNELASKIVDKFLFYYGVVCSNFALMQKATGGLYLAGGIAPKLKQFLIENNSFLEGFHSKGRFTDYLQDIPIYLVEDENCALQGCSNYMQSLSGH